MTISDAMPAWSLRDLTPDDTPELQALFERCADFFELTQGGPPGPAEAASEFEALPDGASYDDKDTVGIDDADGRLIGALDIVHGWPDENTVMLGLLILEPGARRRGIGAQVIEGLSGAWRAEGFERVRIGVAAGSSSALRFWERHGFAETERKPREEMAGGEIVVMVRDL